MHTGFAWVVPRHTRPFVQGRSEALTREVDLIALHITYAESDGQVVCRIMDDGPGFGAAILRTDWTRWPEPTQHLGLTLAASTLHAHGGRMVVSNHEGGGALVDICLPSAQSAATAVGQ